MIARHRIGIALGLFILVSVGFWVHPYRAQQASRYALTAAVAEHGTVELDRYEHVLGVDRSVRNGTVYSDKAPGQPFMAVPFYLVYRMAGGQPAENLLIEGNVGLWWQTFWFASLPLALLGYAMFRDATRFSDSALAGTLSLVFGTLLLPFGALLFGHVLSALCVYGAWLLLRLRARSTRLVLIAVGALIGVAVLVEYTATLAGVVLLIYAGAKHRAESLWAVLGGAPLAVLLGWYNDVAFGSPFTVSYSFSAFDEVTETARPVTSIFGSFRPDHLGDLFLSPRGFLIASPIVVVALVAAVALAARRSTRLEGVIPIVMFGIYLLIPLFWGNPWGGDSPGARYMIPALPFLAVPAAVAWDRFRLPAALATLVSGATMISATLTDPMLARDGDWGLNVWLRSVFAGDFVPSLPSVAWGPLGTVVTVGAIIGAAAVLFVTQRRWPADDSR